MSAKPPYGPRDDDRPQPKVASRPFGVPIVERTPQQLSQERDRQTPKHGRAIPEPTFEDITGRYEGDERREMRSRRRTEDRLERLEEKHDSLDEKVDRIDIAVAGIAGQMKILPDLIGSLKDELAARREDDHVVLKQTLEVGAHEAKSRIDTQQVAVTSKWKMAVRIVSGLFSAGVLGAAIALAASRC